MEIRDLRIERNRKHGKEFPSDTKKQSGFLQIYDTGKFSFRSTFSFLQENFPHPPSYLPPLTYLFCTDHESLAHPSHPFQGMKWIVFLKCIFIFFPL